MSKAALFRITKTWKKPRCSPTDEWIKKTWFIHAMEYYFSFTKKEMLQWETKWMKLENIMLSEVSQSPKDKYCSNTVRFSESKSGMVG